MVVTTPEPTAITDAYAMIKVLAGRKYEGRISLLVNMADSIAEGQKDLPADFGSGREVFEYAGL